MMAIHCTVAENLATEALLPLQNSMGRTWKLITNGLFLTLLSSAKLSMRTSMLSSAVLYSLLSMSASMCTREAIKQFLLLMNREGEMRSQLFSWAGTYVQMKQHGGSLTFKFTTALLLCNTSVFIWRMDEFTSMTQMSRRASEPQRPTLTAYFQLCQNDQFAKTLLYCEVPRYYRWDTSAQKWCRHIQGTPVENQPGIKSSETLGRVYTVHLTNFECFCLRLLLHIVRGPTSFDDLRVVDGQRCCSFKEACSLRGLLEDDAHWKETLEQAVVSHSPVKLQNLFVV